MLETPKVVVTRLAAHDILRAETRRDSRTATEISLPAGDYLEGADLQKANLRGADLTEEAIGDATTKLPKVSSCPHRGKNTD